MKSKMLCAALLASAFSLPAQAATCGNNGSGFPAFIKEFHKEAAAQGIGRQALRSSTAPLTTRASSRRTGPRIFFPRAFLNFRPA